MKRFLIFAVIIVMLFAVGCGEPAYEGRLAEGSFEFNSENMPKFAVTYEQQSVAKRIVKAVLGDEAEPNDFITVKATADECYLALSEGECDMIIAPSYSDEVLARFSQEGIALQNTVIGYDALIFCVSADNPVDDLSLETIKQIYNGDYKKWSELGGANEQIFAFARYKKDFCRERADLVLGEHGSSLNHKITIDGIKYETSTGYDNSAGALGYSLLSSGGYDSMGEFKVLSVDGVFPSEETVKSGEYHLGFGIYVSKQPDGEQVLPVDILYEWLFGTQGRQMIFNNILP